MSNVMAGSVWIALHRSDRPFGSPWQPALIALNALSAMNDSLDALQKLKQAVLTSVDFQDLAKMVGNAFGSVRIVAQVLSAPAVLCRVRVGTDPFTHRDQISYNRKPGWGRCNLPGEPLFYASNSPIGLAMEVSAKRGQILTLGYWRSKAPLLCSIFGLSDNVRVRLGAVLPETVSNTLRDAQQVNEQLNEAYRYFENGFTEIVREDNQIHYKLTAAVAGILLGKIADSLPQEVADQIRIQPAGFHGLIFPTIAARGNCRNFAIRPEAVDSSLELFRVEAFGIERVRETTCEVVPLGSGSVADDGTICWKDEFEWEFDVNLASGHVRVCHGKPDFRVIDSNGNESIGF